MAWRFNAVIGDGPLRFSGNKGSEALPKKQNYLLDIPGPVATSGRQLQEGETRGADGAIQIRS
jgi:hypothetical protein